MSKRKRSSFFANLSPKQCLLLSSPFWLAAVASQDLQAATFNATDMATLRAAIDSANASGTSDTINIAAGTYTLTGAALDNANASGDLDITKATGDLQIIGAGAGSTIIDGASLDRVFHINAGSGITVTIQDLTIQNGQATDDGTTAGEGRGGAILLEQGGLALDSVVVDGNSAQGAAGAAGANATAQGQSGGAGGAGGDALGGAMYLGGSAVQITGSTFSSNSATGGAGGAGGDANQSSTFFGSAGDGGAGGVGGTATGGAICLTGGSLSITQSTLSGNAVQGGAGGDGGEGETGFNADGDGGAAGDGGTGLGGGVFCGVGTTLNVVESTLSANTVTAGDGGDGGNAHGFTATFGGDGGDGGDGGAAHGGGIYAGGTLTLVNSTVSGNNTTAGDAGNAGGGVFSAYGTPGVGGDGGNGGSSRGGGVFAATGSTLDIDNSTLALGTATGGAGGAAGSGGSGSGTAGSASTSSGGNVSNSGTGTADSTIVADGTAGAAADYEGDVTAGASLFETAPSGTLTPGTGTNITGTDPVLSALANNGGPTETHAIDTASAARDAGSNPLTLATDQRGLNRDDGGGVDMGAYEFGAGAAATTPPSVSDPASVTVVNATSYNVMGTAPADSLVRVYSDANNNGVVDGADAVVGSQQLTGGATAFSISVSLTQDVDNNFTATADDGTTGESNPVNVPTITEDSTAPTGTTVTDPATALNTTGTTYTIVGTAEAGSTVQIYSDFNNNGVIDGADAVVASGTATGGNFSISTPITQSTTNNFTATASDAASNESNPVDVPTITETTAPAISPPIVSTPATTVAVDAAAFDIMGTAQADSLVRVYSDLNNDGFINGADAVVGSLQLTGGATAWTINVPLTQSATNSFLATAEDGSSNESLPTDVPDITESAGGTSGGGGGGGDGGGCAVGESGTRSWLLFGGLVAAMFGLMRNVFRRQEG
ncbi:MAG: choice-of-anchor Q domain-containing protein [Planctomycetota bacterium]